MATDRREFLKGTAGALTAVALMPERLMALGPIRGAPLPVAIFGCGLQGRAILGELQKLEQVSVAAVCDPEDGRLRSTMRRARGAAGYATAAELLDKHPEVKAVFVASSTHTHRELSTMALQAGLHVYCETPLAHTLEDCRAIAAAARASGGVFACGSQGRSNPIYRLARSFFRSDSVRDRVSMRGQYHRKTTWRFPASDASRERAVNWRLDPEVSIGLAGEVGTQQFDVFNWYTSDLPTRVRGYGSVRAHKDGRTIADTIQCDLLYPDGTCLLYEATIGNSYGGTYELFHGSNAAIKLAWTHGWMFKEADAPTQGWEVYANRQQFHNDEGITLIADATQLASQGKLKEGVGLPNDSLYYALEDFLKSVLEGSAVACPVEEGLRASVVGIRANQAVVSGGEVVIDPADYREA